MVTTATRIMASAAKTDFSGPETTNEPRNFEQTALRYRRLGPGLSGLFGVVLSNLPTPFLSGIGLLVSSSSPPPATN